MAVVRETVLVHGLWVPGFVMAPLAARLAQQGLHCRRFAYAGRAGSCAANAERLYRFARTLGRANFVGHSLGGLVILQALNAHPDLEVGKVVLLGTPARGCAAGQRFARHRVGRWMLGASESLWRSGAQARWNRAEPLGIVAGTLPIGLGRAFGSLPGANDGVVCVEETEVEGMTGKISMPVGHSQMLLSARVAAQTAAFLEHGRFGE